VIEIRQYVDRQGRTPFLKWLDALSDEAQARVVTALGRLEEGNLSAVKSVGGVSTSCESVLALVIESISAGMANRL
jgi:hypothetical protein